MANKLENLIDSFNNTTLSTSLWNSSTAGSATLSYTGTGAICTFPASSTSATNGDLSAKTTYDLTGSYGYLNVVTVTSSSTFADNTFVLTSGANTLSWQVEAGVIYAQYNNGSVNTVYTTTYNPTTHAWWRIRESGGTVFWDTGVTNGDGSVTWTNRGSVATPFVITALSVDIVGSCFQNETNPGTFKWISFNTSPAPAVTTSSAWIKA